MNEFIEESSTKRVCYILLKLILEGRFNLDEYPENKNPKTLYRDKIKILEILNYFFPEIYRNAKIEKVKINGKNFLVLRKVNFNNNESETFLTKITTATLLSYLLTDVFYFIEKSENFYSYKRKLKNLNHIIALKKIEDDERVFSFIYFKNNEILNQKINDIKRLKSIFLILLKAFLNRKQVRIKYKKPLDLYESEFNIEPLKILNYDGKWYLVAFSPGFIKNSSEITEFSSLNYVRYYKLVDIKEVILTNIDYVSKFDLYREKPFDSNANNYIKFKTSKNITYHIDKSFGIYFSEEIEIAEIIFYPEVLNIIADFQWHKSQKIKYLTYYEFIKEYEDKLGSNKFINFKNEFYEFVDSLKNLNFDLNRFLKDKENYIKNFKKQFYNNTDHNKMNRIINDSNINKYFYEKKFIKMNISIPAGKYGEIIGQMLKYAPYCEPITPFSLKEEWDKRLKEIFKAFNNI